jgi:hypothetical protein
VAVWGGGNEESVGVTHDVAAAGSEGQGDGGLEEEEASATGDEGGDEGVEVASALLGLAAVGPVAGAVGAVDGDGDSWFGVRRR